MDVTEEEVVVGDRLGRVCQWEDVWVTGAERSEVSRFGHSSDRVEEV